VVAPVLAGLGDAVKLELSKPMPLVLTDPGLLQRVVANIVGNAVRHSPAGEHVLVVASVDRNRLELRVVDRGPGVRGELRDRLFEPFQRLGDTSPEGLGLGLAVAHGLADALDVGIGVDDTPGGGLTMTLSIPLAQPPG
jgi:two-component system sensor histidine kinase KdpD